MKFMKTLFLSKYLFFASLIVGAALFPSCEEVSGSTDTPLEPVTPYVPDEASALSPVEQKEKMETVALDLMDQMPASDFREIADFAEYINNTYGEDYDWDNVGDWAENCYELAREALGTKTTERETVTWGDYTYKYNFIYTNYKALLLASNFTGHFTARNGKWLYSDANDLQFIFNNKTGKECILKLETSGQVKQVYLGDVDEWEHGDSEWIESGYTYTSNHYYDRTQMTIGVPEKMTVSLTENGTSVVKTTLKIDLSDISGSEFNLSSSNLSVSSLTELNNGYTFDMSQVAYTAAKPFVKYAISKNDVELVSFAAAADLNDIPSCNFSAFSSENFDVDDYDTDDANAKNAYVKFDMMGKLQIQGTISDVRKFADYIEKAEEYDTNESTFKSYVNLANSLMDISLFYDGSAAKQAAVKFEPFIDEFWGGMTYWYAEPVMVFYDGSSYSSFEAFFNEIDFRRAIDAFEALAERYADLVDERIDW